MYAVRFNSPEEAKEKMPVGKELFYASFDENITKTVFPNELAKSIFPSFLSSFIASRLCFFTNNSSNRLRKQHYRHTKTCNTN
uniref:Uncharacterized protein n=1 Tax=Meloidogyne incognita TaxID=6306 RepID=A0A914KLK0_MELIC